MEIIIVLHNIRSAYNVGAILRTAEGLGISSVICSGYTPWFKKPGLLPHLSSKLKHQIGKSALGAEEMVKVSWSEDINKALAELKGQGFQIIGLENNLEQKSILLNDFKTDAKKIVLVLGEEVNGIPRELYPEIDLFLEIPMKGRKESFNVSVAAGIALYALNQI